MFWAVAVAALAGMALMATSLAETRLPAERRAAAQGNAAAVYGALLRDRHYLGLVFTGGFAMAGFFVYLANSSFVMIDHYGLAPATYSVAFGVNAAAFFGASQLNGPLGERFGLAPLARGAATACAAVMGAMLLYYATGGDRLVVLLVLYFIASGLMGLVIPTTSVLALEEHGAHAGAASALLGTLQMLSGAAAMQIVGLFSTGKPLPMVVGMATGALIGVALAWITLGGARAHRVGAKGHS